MQPMHTYATIMWHLSHRLKYEGPRRSRSSDDFMLTYGLSREHQHLGDAFQYFHQIKAPRPVDGRESQ
jgi:hypothetical protein